MPTLMVAAMLRVMDLLKVIDIVYVMTGGGPGHASETINLYNYLVALSYDKIGYGSAIALVLFAHRAGLHLGLIRLRRAGLMTRAAVACVAAGWRFAVAGWTVTLGMLMPFLWMVLGSFKTTRRLPRLPAGLRCSARRSTTTPGVRRQRLPPLRAEQHDRRRRRHRDRTAARHSRRLRAGALAPHRRSASCCWRRAWRRGSPS